MNTFFIAAPPAAVPGALASSSFTMFKRAGQMAGTNSLVASGLVQHVSGTLAQAIATAAQLSAGPAAGLAVIKAQDGFNLAKAAVIDMSGQSFHNEDPLSFHTSVEIPTAKDFASNFIGFSTKATISDRLAAFVDDATVFEPNAEHTAFTSHAV